MSIFLTAREIVAFFQTRVLEKKLLKLVDRLHHGANVGKEVFYGLSVMSCSADYLLQLMKRHIDELVAGMSMLFLKAR